MIARAGETHNILAMQKGGEQSRCGQTFFNIFAEHP
jgi:hypothetical protein